MIKIKEGTQFGRAFYKKIRKGAYVSSVRGNYVYKYKNWKLISKKFVPFPYGY